MANKMIEFKDGFLTEFNYDSNTFGGCPTCGCGCDIEGEFYLVFDTGLVIRFEQVCEDSLTWSGYYLGFIDEDSIIKILGSQDVKFSEFTINDFIQWFTSKLVEAIVRQTEMLRAASLKVTVQYPGAKDIVLNISIPGKNSPDNEVIITEESEEEEI